MNKPPSQLTREPAIPFDIIPKLLLRPEKSLSSEVSGPIIQLDATGSEKYGY
jgi:hypothetical protein